MQGNAMQISSGILTIAFILLVVYFRRLFTYWKRKGVPYLSPSFPCGNFGNPFTSTKPLYIHLQDLHRRLKRQGHKYGGIYGYASPIFLPIDPEYIKYFFVQNPTSSLNRGFYSNEEYQPASVSIFTTDGEKWKILRTKLTPAFTPSKIKAMFALILEVANGMDIVLQEHITTKTSVNIRDFSRRFAGNVILSCAFGIDGNNLENNRINTLLSNVMDAAVSFFRMALFISLPNFARRLGVPLLPQKETQQICDYILDTVKYRRNNKITRNDLLQTLIDMENLNTITLTELVSQCLLFYIAGFETSSTSLTFTLFELANNQDVQEELRKEIIDTLSKHNGEITYQSISEMKYLEMVISEGLRMYPSIPILFRKCGQDIVLPNSDVVLEKDTTILASAFGLHYDPEYFSDPYKFDPTRFSDPKTINPHTYVPFGSGPRYCLGENLAKLEIKVAIVSIIKNYRLKLNPKMKLPLRLSTQFLPTAKEDILLDVDVAE